jgi:uncharacterized protein with beta-barrel porin domain
LWARLHRDRTAFEAGSAHGGTAQMSGIVFGGDWTVANRWLVGGGGGYSSGTLVLDDLIESSDYTAPRAFGFIGYSHRRWIAHAGASLARSAYSTRRKFDFAAQLPAAFGGTMIFGGVDREAVSSQAGMASEAWGDWSLPVRLGMWVAHPETTFRYARYGRGTWNESGAQGLSLTGQEQAITSVQGGIGARVTRMNGRFRPNASATYRRELSNGRTMTSLQLPNHSDELFYISGAELPRNSFAAHAGLNFEADRFGLSLGFDLRRASGQTRNAIEFGVGF